MIKRTTKLKMKHNIIILSILVVLGCILFDKKSQIDILNEIINDLGFIIVYIYIPILLLLLWLVMKIKAKKQT
ncbi:hypothetical protein AN964_03430 [Heyndrickxia shackletonii]|uniref:Uncharacterized protein n=1 Tax=Heyndrickxia shackletonii TaxID=157838 RepID=A0A0Q3WVC2_9BACI|nr:hypothetical protein AN964_03430 [Heyndrickxia shackletonii]